ncbi:MAG: aminoacyl-tRNA hydrolase [Candidatus Azambacteria bacterium]|nr:aminoacyl-tRNA hydrolase [Candidatus Azambacteria bacterium]
MKYIIIGLGNPNAEYDGCRHNVGKMTVESVRRAYDLSEFKENKKVKVLESKGKVGKHEVVLLSPEIFMNNNGKVLLPYIKSKKDAERLVVIYDDLDLPMGKMKMSFGRSSGGHKGLESVMRTIKTKDFLRVRVGISPATAKGLAKKPSGEEAVIKFILGKFKPAELDILKKEFKKVSEGIKTFIESGREMAMSTFN